MTPTQLVHERITRAQLARLRRAVGVTGYELPDNRDPSSAWVVVACAVGIAACLALGVVL